MVWCYRMKKMELTFHAGDEYVPSFEPDSLIILVSKIQRLQLYLVVM